MQGDPSSYMQSDPQADKAAKYPVPVGFTGQTMAWPLQTPPAGWLEMSGQEVAIDTYPDLYDLFGINFNTGGETAGYFRLPNWNGDTFLRGRSAANQFTSGGSATHNHALTNAFARVGMSSSGQLAIDDSHSPITTWTADRHMTGPTTVVTNTSRTGSTTIDGSTDSGSSLPPWVSALWVVKT